MKVFGTISSRDIRSGIKAERASFSNEATKERKGPSQKTLLKAKRVKAAPTRKEGGRTDGEGKERRQWQGFTTIGEKKKEAKKEKGPHYKSKATTTIGNERVKIHLLRYGRGCAAAASAVAFSTLFLQSRHPPPSGRSTT